MRHKTLLSLVLLVHLGNACELHEFIQDLKKYQVNSKLNNGNKALIGQAKRGIVKSKKLYKEAKKLQDKAEKREKGEVYEY